MASPTRLPTKIGHILHSSEIPCQKPSAVPKPLNCITHNTPGTYFLTAGNSKSINLFNASTASHVHRYDAHGWELTDLSISHDSSKFASVGGDKTVFYWDVATGVTIRRFAGHFARNNAVEFGGEGSGSVIVSGSYDATVKVWDCRASSGGAIQTLDQARDSITSIYLNAHQIVSGSVDGEVRTYDLRKGMLRRDVVGSPVTSVRQSSDNQTMIVSSLDATVRLFDLANGGLLNAFTGHRNGDYRIPSVWGNEEGWVVSGSEDGRVVMWDVVSGEVIADVKAHAGKVVSGVSLHQKTGQMITCGGDGDVVMWTF